MTGIRKGVIIVPGTFSRFTVRRSCMQEKREQDLHGREMVQGTFDCCRNHEESQGCLEDFPPRQVAWCRSTVPCREARAKDYAAPHVRKKRRKNHMIPANDSCVPDPEKASPVRRECQGQGAAGHPRRLPTQAKSMNPLYGSVASRRTRTF